MSTDGFDDRLIRAAKDLLHRKYLFGASPTTAQGWYAAHVAAHPNDSPEVAEAWQGFLQGQIAIMTPDNPQQVFNIEEVSGDGASFGNNAPTVNLHGSNSATPTPVAELPKHASSNLPAFLAGIYVLSFVAVWFLPVSSWWRNCIAALIAAFGFGFVCVKFAELRRKYWARVTFAWMAGGILAEGTIHHWLSHGSASAMQDGKPVMAFGWTLGTPTHVFSDVARVVAAIAFGVLAYMSSAKEAKEA